MEEARLAVREWIRLGHAKTGMVRVRSGDPLPPSGRLCWTFRDTWLHGQLAGLGETVRQ
jgi:hypothetical protein